MTQEQYQAQIDRLTGKLKRAEKTLHDWFVGQALAGSSVAGSREAGETAARAFRIADAVMRLREERYVTGRV